MEYEGIVSKCRVKLGAWEVVSGGMSEKADGKEYYDIYQM